jgi:hypothetical protein
VSFDLPLHPTHIIVLVATRLNSLHEGLAITYCLGVALAGLDEVDKHTFLVIASEVRTLPQMLSIHLFSKACRGVAIAQPINKLLRQFNSLRVRNVFCVLEIPKLVGCLEN